MTSIITSNEAIEGMRVAGRLAAQTLEMIIPHVVPGISTLQLDELCHAFIVDECRAIPAPLNYRGFPKSICTSVNNVICHGIPCAQEILKNGDIINIDVTVKKNGWHGDTSVMLPVGKCTPASTRLIDVTQQCLYLGIEQAREHNRLGDIGHVIQKHAQSNGFSVVRDYCGHGIGKVFHDDPQVLHYGKANTGLKITPGLCFTIEPMINAGTLHTKLLADNWTVKTKDRRLSAQWEHTLLITENGLEVLTARTDEVFSF